MSGARTHATWTAAGAETPAHDARHDHLVCRAGSSRKPGSRGTLAAFGVPPKPLFALVSASRARLRVTDAKTPLRTRHDVRSKLSMKGQNATSGKYRPSGLPDLARRSTAVPVLKARHRKPSHLGSYCQAQALSGSRSADFASIGVVSSGSGKFASWSGFAALLPLGSAVLAKSRFAWWPAGSGPARRRLPPAGTGNTADSK